MLYRDLGGIRNRENKIIKENVLIRSGNLSKISGNDLKQLKKLPVHKIIDLRTEQEKSEKPDKKIGHAEYLHIPIFNDKTLGITYEKDIQLKDLLSELPDMANLYRTMVTSAYSVGQLRKIINEIINANAYPVLFHCTAGKDRTGIVTMLLLSMLDVNEDEIFEDYLKENERNRLKRNFLYSVVLLMTGDRLLAKKVKNFYTADEEYLKAAIEAINEKYGNVGNFIRNELGVSDRQKEAFKRQVLEEY